jgi:hypothetical protein
MIDLSQWKKPNSIKGTVRERGREEKSEDRK